MKKKKIKQPRVKEVISVKKKKLHVFIISRV